MTTLRTLLESLGNTGAVANARREHDRLRHEDALLTALARRIERDRAGTEPSAA